MTLDPDHEEYKGYIEWLGEKFEPEYFNKDEVNEFLREKDMAASNYK